MRIVPRLDLEPRPSRLLVATAVVVGVASAALLARSMPSRVAALAAVLVCLGAMLRAIAQLRRTPRRVSIALDRTITVVDHRGAALHGTIEDATYVTGLYTAVVWRPRRRTRTCVWAVAPDCLCAEDRRRLRLWLRYAVAPPEESSPSGEGSSVVTADAPASHA